MIGALISTWNNWLEPSGGHPLKDAHLQQALPDTEPSHLYEQVNMMTETSGFFTQDSNPGPFGARADAAFKG